MEIIYNFLLFFMVISAAYALFTHNLLNSIIALSIFSANLIVLFIILQAPDVALVEVIVSSGISTGFFIVTINKLEGIE
ncbi:Na(+)/H(+) antiporter subunit B [Natroniella sp. ANB-PHB2]|uniref:Na(+)/H(+) antiporter subunit B n=1 Tax=Natroniella sp. ANB-PHB2 TaxID=3384444 RepID=UPI0038D3B08E